MLESQKYHDTQVWGLTIIFNSWRNLIFQKVNLGRYYKCIYGILLTYVYKQYQLVPFPFRLSVRTLNTLKGTVGENESSLFCYEVYNTCVCGRFCTDLLELPCVLPKLKADWEKKRLIIISDIIWHFMRSFHQASISYLWRAWRYSIFFFFSDHAFYVTS